MKTLVGGAVAMVLLALFAVGGLVSGLGSSRGTPQAKSTIREHHAEVAPQEGVVIPIGGEQSPIVTTSSDSASLPPNVLNPTSGVDATAATSQIYTQTSAPSAPSAPASPAVLQDPRQVTDTTISRNENQQSANQPSASRLPREERNAFPPPIVIEEHRKERAERRSENRTSPQPVYQPVPSVEKLLREDGTFKVRLTVGADGRVTEVEVLQPLAGATARLIGAIQHWKFRPATEDGRAVEGTFETELSFNAQR